MTGNEIYKRTETYERAARTIRLHAPEWKLLLSFDGERSLANAALHAQLSFTEAKTHAQKFVNLDWIEEQPITLDQFLQQSGAPEIAPPTPSTPSTMPTIQVAPTPEPEPVTPPPLPAVTSAPIASKVISAPPPLDTARASRLPRGPMRLGAVVDYITSLVGNTALGQLLVYRVFLRVPPELLQAEDIVSIHLVNDTSLIRTAALQQAIAKAVSEVAKRPLPDGVFAPA